MVVVRLMVQVVVPVDIEQVRECLYLWGLILSLLELVEQGLPVIILVFRAETLFLTI